MFLVFCLSISAFDSSQPRDVDKMSDRPAFYILLPIFFHSFLFSFFPFAFPFLVMSSLSLLLFLLPMLLYSIIISLYVSMLVSHDLSILFYFLVIAFHCFSFSVPFNVLFYLYPLLPSSPFFDFSVLCIFYCFCCL